MNYIAIDIGGTKIKFGIADDSGSIYENSEFDTEAYKGAEELIKKVYTIIDILLKKEFYNIKGIGISTAGQVNSETGEIIFATNTIPGWTGVKLKNIIEEKYHLPCIVENDVNAAALGELWMGAGKGVSNFICLTIGTGIGGAIIINNNIFTGRSYSAGEFGHINLYPDGLECTCGHTGCYEVYASTTALVKRAREVLKNSLYKNEIDSALENINGKVIFEKVNNGDEFFISIVDNWCRDIALGLKTLIHVFNPELIIIGGGVSAQGNSLIDRIEKYIKNMVMPSFSKNLKVDIAKCGNIAGMLGAVYSLKIKLEL
ncbi:ROK family protein [Clostridium nigeriense]|uniref:ROK family protein n=1 Tax=Clostridium nigeriense TaxID=1805470 RepID=UPI003D33A4A5